MEPGDVREILCRVCGQTNIRYEGGWRGFWLRPRQAYLCTFCRANLDTGTFHWADWPTRIIMVLVFYGGHALIFAGAWILALLLVLLILARLDPVNPMDKTLRTLSMIIAAATGLAVCEWRRRKGTLLGGTARRKPAVPVP